MTIDPRIAALAPEIAGWRRDIHAHPELGYEEHRTAAFVAEKLRAFGVDEVATGIGKTGVVGVISGRKGGAGRVVGLRADMDALPIHERTNLPYRSTHPGKMHACGHDGHTAMLLGAAKHLAATRDFDGAVVVIFQPAEEGGAGGRAMVQDGLMERFGIQEVYGMHNLPGLAAGAFATATGPIMAAVDEFTLRVIGRGGHAAMPHTGVDPVLAGAHLITALQAIAARTVDPLKSVVVSMTMFHAGEAFNVIPDVAVLGGTVRSFEPAVRDLAERRLREIAAGAAQMFGAQVEVDYRRLYPPTLNHGAETGFAAAAAHMVAGAVDTEAAPLMAGEDFSYMLEARPGNFMFIGNGDTAALHNASYDFNDAVIPHGVQYFTTLAHARTRQNAQI